MDVDSDFAIVTGKDICVALSSSEDPYTLEENADLFSSKAKNVLVYAEHIVLKGNIKRPGQNLALICHSLVLAGTSDVVIDVSGANGETPVAKAVGSGGQGTQGQDGGRVFISVEDAAVDLTRLRVRAHGGDGGGGGATSDAAETALGGAGGKGGDAGKITIITANPIHKANAIFTRRIARAKKVSWQGKCLIAQDALSGLSLKLPAMPSFDFLLKVDTDLQSITRIPGSQSDLAKKVSQHLETKYTEFSGLAAYQELMSLLKAQVTGENLQAQLQESFAASTQEALEACAMDISAEKLRLRGALQSRLENTAGRGGKGGQSASSFHPVGAKGTDGTRSQVSDNRCLYTIELGDKLNKDLDLPTFFPDQARQLLRRADSMYLRNDAENVAGAKKLYQRLIQRLWLAPDLQSPNNLSLPIVKFFQSIAEEERLSISPLRELNSTLEDAKTRLSRIELGQDMFGQSPEWAPRLSYHYYEKTISDLITQYKSLSAQLEKYSAKNVDAKTRRAAVGQVREQCRQDTASAQARLDLLTDENGPIRAAAYKIRTYDPLMKTQQRQLKTKMDSVASTVKSSFNLSKIIDAFTTLASTRSKFDAVKNTAKAGYSLYEAATTVEDADGKVFDKALLVKQITECGESLESLQQAISANDDGSIAIEDPGAVKVVTNKENVSKMLEQFKNILPEDMRTELNKDLDTFLATVKTRNDSVLEYNSLAQVVRELTSAKKRQSAMLADLSQEKLTLLDPTITSIVNWLGKTRDDLAMATMQQMNFASRAISYWGLLGNLPLGEVGPLHGATELEQLQAQLKKHFDKALNSYASASWSYWPTKDNSIGRIHKLSAKEIGELKEARKDEQGKKTYMLKFALDPDSSGLAGIGANVRIRQIRLWLGGATVSGTDDGGKRLLTMTLTHSGTEIIQKDNDTTFRFAHSPVTIGFTYECTSVKTLADAKSKYAFGTQSIEKDYKDPTVSSDNASAIAPLGPFTLWTVTIREKDNPGLSLDGVEAAWLELYGRSVSLESAVDTGR